MGHTWTWTWDGHTPFPCCLSTLTEIHTIRATPAAPQSSEYDAAQQAQMEAQERAQQQEMEQLRMQYGHLPESVRMGMRHK